MLPLTHTGYTDYAAHKITEHEYRFYAACHINNINRFIKYSSNTYDINMPCTSSGLLPIHLAGVSIDFCKHIVETKGADVNRPVVSTSNVHNGKTVLHIQTEESKDAECTKYLISKGANIGIQDSNGSLPLHNIFTVLWSGYLLDNFTIHTKDLILLLGWNSPLVNVQDSLGHTPINLAVQCLRMYRNKVLYEDMVNKESSNDSSVSTLLLSTSDTIKQIEELLHIVHVHCQ